MDNGQIEELVTDGTGVLPKTNEQLKLEIEVRMQAEQELKESEERYRDDPKGYSSRGGFGIYDL